MKLVLSFLRGHTIYALILLLAILGLVWDVREVPAHKLQPTASEAHAPLASSS